MCFFFCFPSNHLIALHHIAHKFLSGNKVFLDKFNFHLNYSDFSHNTDVLCVSLYLMRWILCDIYKMSTNEKVVSTVRFHMAKLKHTTTFKHDNNTQYTRIADSLYV